MVKGVVGLLKGALAGESPKKIASRAEQVAALAAFKASYRVGRR